MNPYEIAQRLERISYGAHQGQSYSQTKARLDSLAAKVEDEELAQRIRDAVGRKGLSLGNRVINIDKIRADVIEKYIDAAQAADKAAADKFLDDHIQVVAIGFDGRKF